MITLSKVNLRKLLEEIILDFLDIWDNGFNKEDAAAIVNQWTKTPCGSRLIDSLVDGQRGMRWVKASERRPSNDGWYHLKVLIDDTIYPEGHQYSVEYKQFGGGSEPNVIEWLDESPSDGQDWISVEKELPPIGKQVLIYEPDPNGKGKHEQETIAVSHYAGKKPRNEKYWYEWPDGQDEQPGSYYPTHWQPLPEPPKIN